MSNDRMTPERLDEIAAGRRIAPVAWKMKSSPRDGICIDSPDGNRISFGWLTPLQTEAIRCMVDAINAQPELVAEVRAAWDDNQRLRDEVAAAAGTLTDEDFVRLKLLPDWEWADGWFLQGHGHVIKSLGDNGERCRWRAFAGRPRNASFQAGGEASWLSAIVACDAAVRRQIAQREGDHASN